MRGHTSFELQCVPTPRLLKQHVGQLSWDYPLPESLHRGSGGKQKGIMFDIEKYRTICEQSEYVHTDLPRQRETAQRMVTWIKQFSRKGEKKKKYAVYKPKKFVPKLTLADIERFHAEAHRSAERSK